MEKKEFISLIEEQVKLGNISKSDLLNIVNDGKSVNQNVIQDENLSLSEREDHSKNLINTFYAIGGIIAVVGVIVLVVQNWQEIGFVGRILSTLGISLLTYISGLVLRNSEHRVVSGIMFIISAVLVPISAIVLAKEAEITFGFGAQLVTSLVALVIFAYAMFVSRRNILFLISLGFASWAYYSFIFKILNFSYNDDTDILKWATMLLGISFVFLAYGYKKIMSVRDIDDESEQRRVQGVIYGLGTLAILSSGISFGGFFDLIFIALIFGAFYGSVFLKSRAMLILGALFLVGHIIKLTSKYFFDSIGWAVSLIFVGFLVIGIGYLTFYLNRRFISKS